MARHSGSASSTVPSSYFAEDAGRLLDQVREYGISEERADGTRRGSLLFPGRVSDPAAS